jgi:hypothetical protein
MIFKSGHQANMAATDLDWSSELAISSGSASRLITIGHGTRIP